MEVICDSCKKTYIYKGGKAHFQRAKNHFCGKVCQAKARETHGLSIRKSIDKRYRMWGTAKKRAKQKGWDFDLEIEDIPEIPEYCPVLGIEIKANTTHAPLDTSPSLDRIDSTKGYIKGNIRVISNRANRIKADATYEELIKIVEDLKQYENTHD